ncbi:BCR family protein [Gammaproteobacteria bacterium]|jgi:ribosome maturation factor RimP|nr:BCR family protein [Gammaproteobacteria bacterium]
MRIEEMEHIIKPVAKSHGCELWGIDLLRGKKRPTIRAYIDAIAGATIEDCEKVAKDLNFELALDDNFIDKDYILEVSTPGIDRKFFNVDQLALYIDEEFTLKLRESVNGKKSLVARLVKINEEKVCFQNDDEDLNLNFIDIDICRLKPNFKEIMRGNE